MQRRDMSGFFRFSDRIPWEIAIMVIIAAIIWVYMQRKFEQWREREMRKFERWREREVSEMREQNLALARREMSVELEKWKSDSEKRIREDAI